ncbi:MAG: lipoprotein signal peptidase [Gammaproteobacteria bacterium]|nr:lipoprotein signal peptidase [Gammaproteobacteria bacterium]
MSKWLSLAFVVLVLDQLTKYWVVTTLEYGERVQILPFFAWVRWHNDGAAFSFLAGSGGWQRWFFVVIAVAFSAYLIYEISRLPKQQKIMGWVFGLILGGALGNLIDRVVNGYVVDFVLLHYNQYIFPAFNVADSALFCGAALWILMMILERRSTSVEGAND